MNAIHEEIMRLVADLPDDRADLVLRFIRVAQETNVKNTEPPQSRQYDQAKDVAVGLIQGRPDLAENAEEILRNRFTRKSR